MSVMLVMAALLGLDGGHLPKRDDVGVITSRALPLTIVSAIANFDILLK